MGSVSKTLLSPSRRHQKKLTGLLKPFHELFSTCYFGQITLSPEGEVTYLSDYIDIAEYFYDNELYKGHPRYSSPEFNKEGLFLESTNSDSCLQKVNRELQHHFPNLQQPVYYSKNRNGKLTHYLIMSDEECDLENEVINQAPLIEKFIEHFERETDSLNTEVEDAKVSIIDEYGVHFQSPSPHSTTREKILAFLKATLPDYPQLHRITTLTKNEHEALLLFAEGMTTAEVAKHLNRAPRTLEKRLDAIKLKLRFEKKSDLVRFLIRHKNYLQYFLI